MTRSPIIPGTRHERGTTQVLEIDLGLEPPIEADGGRHTPLDRRRVSLRWLSGTILTGLSGAALIGSAIFAALDRQSNFAEAPVLAQANRRETSGESSVNTRKSDRLVKAIDIVAAKQTFKTPTTIKVGDREVVKNKSFTRVATNLATASTGFADDVPAFNPLKLLADSRNPIDARDTDAPAPEDADVSFQTRDLAGQTPSANAVSLTEEEVQAQVDEQSRSGQGAGAKPSLPIPSQMLLMRTSRATLDPGGALAYANIGNAITNTRFSSIEVRMVPENVTTIAKTVVPVQPTQMDERLAIVRKGETLEEILRANSVPRERIAAIVAAFGVRRSDSPIAEGNRVKLLFADMDGSGTNMTLARISVYADEQLTAMVAITDRGSYLQVTRAAQTGKPAKPASDDDDDSDDEADKDSGGMRLYDSLYETALKQEIPREIIDNLVRVFANDIDFQRSVAAGDTFEAFYDENDEGEGRNDLLFASITTRGETFRYYRYQTLDDNSVDFYDENGRSTRKFLIRKPISIGETRSGFGMRRHPILGYAKMHSGIDWAAPIGTPIFAAGNGTVLKAAYDGGYGRRVEIQHANGYISTYNHMSAFGRGINAGTRVRQGQVIGYLGSSGLSTGPHLHYEIMVNGHFVDPMRVKLARTKEFDGKLLSDFKRERDRIDALIAKAPNATRVAERKTK